jgi:hypothetical protein
MIFNSSYAWYAINFDADQNKFSDNEQAKSSRDLIAGFIDELILNYSIDAKGFFTWLQPRCYLKLYCFITSRKN